MIYCDTSLLIAAFTAEARSDVAQSWMLEQARPTLITSDWSVTEFANAIARKQQRGDLAWDHRIAAEQAWNVFRAELTHVDVTRSHFERAAHLADIVPPGLRAGDALHLAIVLERGCALATFDRGFAEAARTLGVAVHPAA